MFACRARRKRGTSDHAGIRRMTERDRMIIAAVALHGAASRAQLMELGYFTSVSRANRRLRMLSDDNFLRRTYVATGPNRSETVYILGTAGSHIVSEGCDLDPIELKRQTNRVPARMFLEHHLLVLSVRLLAERLTGGVRLAQFLTEPECRHEYKVVARSRTDRRLIKPDAVALFDRAGEQLPVFIEVDRGHVSLPQMSGMFERYGRYWTDGAFTDAYGNAADTPFTVAVITTAGPRRINHLRNLAKRVPVPVRFAKYEELRARGFLGNLWVGAKDGQVGSLWDDPREVPG